MRVFQKEFNLPPYPRGFHIITRKVLEQFPEIKEMKAGVLQVFIKHTSAGLSINENADPTVRKDFETHFNKMVPERAPYYEHTIEGDDDMPAHIKTTLVGNNVSLPVTDGELNLGIWQGIYLCEFRNHGGARELVATLIGG